MVDNRAKFPTEVIALLKDSYGKMIKIYDTEIPISIKVVEASERGTSIYEHNNKGKVAAAYRAFAQEVMDNEK